MNYIDIELGHQTYKARLGMRGIDELERRLGQNPLNVLITANNTHSLPKISDLITIIHVAIVNQNHGVKLDDLYEAYQEELNNGGNIDKLIDIVIAIFQSCGLLENAQ